MNYVLLFMYGWFVLLFGVVIGMMIGLAYNQPLIPITFIVVGGTMIIIGVYKTL